MPTYTIGQIAGRVKGRLIGPDHLAIHAVDPLNTAGEGCISFIRDNRHAKQWGRSKATAVLVSAGVDLEPGPGRALVQVDDADVSLAVVLEMFAPPAPKPQGGVHPSATVDEAARVSPDAAIGPGCVIGERVTIGAGCVLHANVCVMDDAVIGPGCVLFPGVVIYHHCELGSGVIVHANTVIGADGFGYRPAPEGSGLVKIPQIGTVKIGNDVEIGAGACIDRGKFSATVIGDGTKIDNLCHIAHNCRIGKGCVLAAQVGLSGSVVVGDGVAIGGQVGVADHFTVGDGAQLAAQAGVISDVPAGARWFGTPAHDLRATLREAVALRRLPDLIKTLKKTSTQDG